MTDPKPRDLQRDLRKLRDLLDSRGWTLLREAMERDIVAAAMAIANDPRMPLDEINFRRGAIWAGHQLLKLPDALAARLAASLALAESQGEQGQAEPRAEAWPEWHDADDAGATSH